MERTRFIRSILLERGLHREISCKANALPFKSMIYAISNVRNRVKVTQNSSAALYMQILSSQSKTLNLIADGLHQAIETDSDVLSKSIKASVSAYVNLFYSLSKRSRNSYLTSFNHASFKSVRPERNLLLIPAIMADRGEPKRRVINGLYFGLYKAPFKAIYEPSKAALQIVSMEQRIGVKRPPKSLLDGFEKAVRGLDSRIKDIEEGTIKPKADQKIKDEFIEKALEFSKLTDSNLTESISERIETEKARLARLHRIKRRKF